MIPPSRGMVKDSDPAGRESPEMRRDHVTIATGIAVSSTSACSGRGRRVPAIMPRSLNRPQQYANAGTADSIGDVH
jgi:hypothetical protein